MKNSMCKNDSKATPIEYKKQISTPISIFFYSGKK